jgi:hypothetical protein
MGRACGTYWEKRCIQVSLVRAEGKNYLEELVDVRIILK